MTWPLDCVRRTELLANHTSFRIGGPAELFAESSTVDGLIGLLRMASRVGLPVSVLGGGTNCLVADRGIRGLVVHLGKAFRTVNVLHHPDEPEVRVRCGAAVLTQRVVRLGGQHGWTGVETLAGLPGQVGGAVVMNAQNIGQFVEQITVVSLDGTVHQLTREHLKFAYRYTALEPGVIVDVALQFSKTSPEDSATRIHEVFCRRNSTQEVRLPSAGCAFKNPPDLSAGRLIDRAGLKGTRIGDAQVSSQHANFIVNLGGASCDDVLSLMEHIQRRVRQRFNISLEPEIRVLGERWGHEHG